MTLFLQISIFMAKRHLNLFHVTLKLHEVRLILSRISPHRSLPTRLLQDQQKPFKREGL